MEKTKSEASVTFAGFWIRTFATLIDMIFLGIPLAFLLYMVFESGNMDFHGYLTQDGFSFTKIVENLIFIGITVYLWVNWNGQTPGKKLLGIKVVKSDNFSNLDYKTAIIRNLSYIPSFLLLGIGILMVGFRKDKKGLHDLIAKTCVIYEK